MKTVILVFTLFVVLYGCDEPFSNDREILNVQILSIRTAPVRFGMEEDLHLDALWARPEGFDKPMTAVWYFCEEYVSFQFQDASWCTLLQKPEIHEAVYSVEKEVLSIPKVVLSYPDEAYITALSAILLLCDGEISQLPDARDKIDLRRIGDHCHGNEHAIAIKWIDRVDPDEGTPQNPEFERILLNGEALSNDDESEMTFSCEAKETCVIDIIITVQLTSASYEDSEKLGSPLDINWYVTSGTLETEVTASFQIEPMTAVWRLDRVGAHELFVIVRNESGGQGFKRLTARLNFKQRGDL